MVREPVKKKWKIRVIFGNLIRLSCRPTLWKVVPGSDSPRTCRTISGDSGARAEPLMQRECCCSALCTFTFSGHRTVYCNRQVTGLYFVFFVAIVKFYHMWETHVTEWLEQSSTHWGKSTIPIPSISNTNSFCFGEGQGRWLWISIPPRLLLSNYLHFQLYMWDLCRMVVDSWQQHIPVSCPRSPRDHFMGDNIWLWSDCFSVHIFCS